MTAKEFAETKHYKLEEFDEGGYLGINISKFEELLVEFAKFHVKQALKAATENAKLKQQYGYGRAEEPGTIDFKIVDIYSNSQYGHGDCSYNIVTLDEGSILDAYPLENIK